ncbi:5'-3' exonuclease H3TH domain-containing protein [Methylobacterium sp. AMS5]|uniref:5'-3' exonuclease H3TH domain-containing protein n=1 Tax=Methylobacterium sp. AMS5 TaxID=925818 RepID=UPI00074F8419|nr:5'-3' exonuclease H3TH domain-containing protein [Methylobacterium sp. AMS5]AMB48367.1 hypothetical protein Y590_25700 [Methylobacterium sp. AMS5]
MEKIGYLLIDANNIGFAATSTTKLTVGDVEVQGVFGGLRMIRVALARYPMLKPIVLWDGATWRKDAFEEYKENRDKSGSVKPYEIAQMAVRESWRKQKPVLGKALSLLGVPQLTAANLEADDWAGILVRRYRALGQRVVLCSGDKDWLQLVQPGVNWWDPIQDKRITSATFSEKIGYMKTQKVKQGAGLPDLIEDVEWRGVPSPRAFLECKALQGDAGDNIPGVGGVGEKGAIELVIQFGDVKGFFEAVEIQKVKVPKKLADFCSEPEKRDRFYRNLRLMDLNHPDIPQPERPRLNKGQFDLEAFEEFCKERVFNSITKDIDRWVEPFYPETSVSTDCNKEAA